MELKMNSTKSKLILSSAIAGLVALSSLSGVVSAQEKKEAKEKCFGVAKKGMNDCGTAKHSCAGLAEKDNQPEEWKFVAKGSCEKMGGKLKNAAKTDEKPAAPKAADAPKY
jgi:uncharacterized membrane protein